jgi:hypothetical protein
MSYPVVILTEGTADDICINKIIEENGLGKDKFHIPKFDQGKFGGITNFHLKISSIRSTIEPYTLSESRAMVIVADNDNNPKAQFEKVCGQIMLANKNRSPAESFGVPQKPREAARQSLTLPPLYVLMLPWDGEEGCLETLCLYSANKTRYKTELDCVERFSDCVGSKNWIDAKKLPDVSRKAKFHVKSILTSICEDPYTPFHCSWNPEKSPMDIFQLKNAAFSNVIGFLAQFTAA